MERRWIDFALIVFRCLYAVPGALIGIVIATIFWKITGIAAPTPIVLTCAVATPIIALIIEKKEEKR